MTNTLADQVLAAWREPIAEQYAARSKPNVHSPALFDDDGDARWITIGSKDKDHHGGHHVKIAKDGTMLTGHFAGQKVNEAFAGEGKGDNPKQTDKRPAQQIMYSGDDIRAKHAAISSKGVKNPKSKAILDGVQEYLDAGGTPRYRGEDQDHMTGLDQIAGHERAVAHADSVLNRESPWAIEPRIESEAKQTGPVTPQLDPPLPTAGLERQQASSGIVETPASVPNVEAKPGSQLGLFGEAAKPAYKRPVFKPTLPESTGKQGGLFDTHGNPDQMDLFGDGVMPEELVFKPEEIKKNDEARVIEKEVKIKEPGFSSEKKAGSKAKTNYDFGEKIDVRKFNSKKTGPREKKEKVVDDRPTWQKRYDIAEDANAPGQFFILDKRTNTPLGKNDVPGSSSRSFSSQINRMLSKASGKPNKDNFGSKEEALDAMHHIEARRNHVIVPNREGKWEIARKFGDSKRATVKGGFATREDADKHLTENPAAIIEHQFPRYEDHQYLSSVERTGKEYRKGDVAPSDMKNAFGFRAGAFGNWQSDKKTGQVALNHAYDAFHDLSDILGLPPKAVSLNGQLAMGFGADGTGGKNSARAHYSPDKGLINLTKMTGAGTLAHEWMHALDHHLAKIAGDKGTSRTARGHAPGNMRPELHKAYQAVKHAIHSKEVTEAIRGPDDAIQQKIDSRKQKDADELAEAKKNDKHIISPHTIAGHLWNIRKAMHETAGYKKKKIDPEKLKEFDKLSAEIEAGNYGEKTFIPAASSSSFAFGRDTYSKLEELNQLHKSMVGRGFHTNDDHSPGKRLKWQITSDLAQKERVKDAEEGKTETKRKKTSYLEEAHKLDSQRSSDYYTMPEEMMSRAFEAYIHDKLSERGHKSDYLGAKAHNKHYVGFGMKPFPEDDERKAINEAFDKFFKELKHEVRSDEKGDHVNVYHSADSKTSWVDRYENELEPLIYNEKAENRARDLYNQFVAVIDRYDWNESEHPRQPGGTPVGGQFSSKTRSLPDHPGLVDHHSMHIKNQEGALRQNLSDWSKGLHRLLANSHRMQGGGADVSEEQLWAGVNKDELRKHLDYMNKLDKHHRESGGQNVANIVNANGLIPKMIAERLHGGSRFFDPRKLRGKFGAPPVGTGENRTPAGNESPVATKVEPTFPEGTASDSRPVPGSHTSLPSSAQQAGLEAVLSKQKHAKLDSAIKGLIGDDPEMVNDFRSIVLEAWSQKKQEAVDHNEAIRTITGTASKLSGATGGTATPQALTALVKAARNRTLDPATKRGFDEMVDSAERAYPHLLGGRGEEGLLDLISLGIRPIPDVMDESVVQHAMSMAGPSFFASHDPGGTFEEAESTNWDSVPFSWLASKSQVDVIRYCARLGLSVEHYAGKGQMAFIWDESDHPRQPKGSKGSIGGEFAKRNDSIDRGYRSVVSGAQSSPSDIASYKLSDRPIGVSVQPRPLSARVVGLLAQHVEQGKNVFLDSGIASTVSKGEGVDFTKVFKKYKEILLEIAPSHRHRVMVVAPDHLEKTPAGEFRGDQAKTLDLQNEWSKEIKEIQDLGASVIVPVQRGGESLSSAAGLATDAIDFSNGKTIFGIPYNKGAWDDGSIREFAKISKGSEAKIHLLGGGKQKVEALTRQLHEIDPDMIITGDAASELRNRNRKKGKPITERFSLEACC